MSIFKKIIKSFKKIFKKKITRKKSKRIKNRKPKNKKGSISKNKDKKNLKKVSKIQNKISNKAPKVKKIIKSKKTKKTTKNEIKNEKLDEEVIGQITHYFNKIQVVVLKLTKRNIKIGETIIIKGKETNFSQIVKSLQVESVDVKSAKKGQLVGLKAEKPAKVGDMVFVNKNKS